MKSIKHVTNTWLLALHLFPILFLIYDVFSSGGTDIYLLLPLAFFGMLFSLPSFLLCLLFITPVLRAPLPAHAKLWVWVLAVSIAIIMGAVLISLLFFGLGIIQDLMPFIACAVIAALFSVLLRLRSFFHLVMLQNKIYEKDLV